MINPLVLHYLILFIYVFFCYVYFVYMYLFCYAAIWTFLNCINNFSDLLIGVLYVQAIKKS